MTSMTKDAAPNKPQQTAAPRGQGDTAATTRAPNKPQQKQPAARSTKPAQC
jgi:hypothetical protein